MNHSQESQTKNGLRWGRILAWSGLFLLLAIVGLGLIRAQEGPIQVGKKAPDFVLTTFDGEEINSQELSGKVILINFWASWCNPCKAEAADLEAAWRIYRDSGEVAFLGVDYVDTAPEAKAYLEDFEITYPNGPDLGTHISQAFRIRGVPETYIIDKNGVLAHAQIGPFQSLDEITAAIDPLLGP